MFDLDFHRKFNDILYILLQPTKYYYLNRHQTEVARKKNKTFEERIIKINNGYTPDEVKYVYDYALSLGLKVRLCDMQIIRAHL